MTPAREYRDMKTDRIIGSVLALALGKDTSSTMIIERLCRHVAAPEFVNRLETANVWIQSGSTFSPRTVAAELGNGIAAVESCVTAIYVALSFRNKSFNELLEFTIRLRGDVDTIAAMAGAIWGAMRGQDALPRARLEQLEQCDRLAAVASSLADAVGDRPAHG